MAPKRILWRGWVAVLASAIAGAAVALLLGQALLIRIADHRLSDYNAALLADAAELARTSRGIMNAVNGSARPPCSDADIDEMRRLSFRSEYLRDVGRLVNGALACTALWGRLPAPVKLPPPQRVLADGDALWNHIDAARPVGADVDAAVHRAAFVSTTPLAFRPYEAEVGAYAGSVVTHDGQYAYSRFGEAAGPPSQVGVATAPARWLDLGARRRRSACVDDVDVCVAGELRDVGVFHLPAWAWSGIALLGAMLGGGLALVVRMRREAGVTLPDRIRRAIALGGLGVAYQPLVRVRDRRIMGVEALARLTGAQGENISPDMFIKVTEEQGLIGDITRRVIAVALREMRPRLLARRDFYCSLNVGVADILDPGLCDYLDEQVARNGLNPRQIILEIAERSTADRDRMVERMRELRGRGYKFYIDDFGTGYSSLAYLARLPINGIKIDRMFTQAIGRESVSSLIVQNICAVASTLGVRVILEGVETPGQAAYIQHIAPEAIGQGWLFAEPMPADAIMALPGEILSAGFKGLNDRRHPAESLGLG